MAKVIIHGMKEDGTIDAESISTAILVTQLIEKLPNMCEAKVCEALEEIRLSAEQDARIRQTYARVIKKLNAEKANEEEKVEVTV
jgi:hypothetical protein